MEFQLVVVVVAAVVLGCCDYSLATEMLLFFLLFLSPFFQDCTH